MMGMLIVGAMATLGVVVSAVLGYLLSSPTDADMPRHVLVGLASSLLLLLLPLLDHVLSDRQRVRRSRTPAWDFMVSIPCGVFVSRTPPTRG